MAGMTETKQVAGQMEFDGEGFPEITKRPTPKDVADVLRRLADGIEERGFLEDKSPPHVSIYLSTEVDEKATEASGDGWIKRRHSGQIILHAIWWWGPRKEDDNGKVAPR